MTILPAYDIKRKSKLIINWERGEYYYESVICKKPCCREKVHNQRNGMFAAVLAVISQISLPMPTGVPITIQVFGVALVGAVLGSRLGTTATLVYVLLGAIGLPIFANFSGGISSIVGVTGGYIWAWPIMTWLCGIRPKTENKTKNLAISIGFALIGLLIVETIGGLQWHFVGGSMSIPAIAVYSLTAFIPKDIVITVLAVLIAIPIRKGINNAGNR